jgi:hypothetical protein
MFILVSVKPLCSKFAAAVDVEIGGIVSYWRVCSRCICTGSYNQIQEGKMVLLAKRLPKESQEWNPGCPIVAVEADNCGIANVEPQLCCWKDMYVDN